MDNRNTTEEEASLGPDPAAAAEFLEAFRPGGPWVLTAIPVEPGRFIQTRTFEESEEDELRRFVGQKNCDHNLYFSINPTRNPIATKAKREDIAELAWLHVDIDPRTGEDPETERERMLALLTSALPGDIPPPTVVLDSGGGFWGMWKLREPYELDGTVKAADDARAWNLELERAFGADSCHNLDRIARLPGTVNWPNAKKRDKGRVPARAQVVEFDENRLYYLKEFARAEIAPAVTPVAAAEIAAVQLGGLEELDQWSVPDRVKVIIAQGRHPEEGPKEGDDSRSAWLFDCVCNLVRCDVPDGIIYGVIMDPDFAISESVLDKGRKAREYALKQIERAKEHAIDPLLAEMNEKYFIVKDEGTKCRVAFFRACTPAPGLPLRRELATQDFADFKKAHMRRLIETGTDRNGNPRLQPLGEWWLRHPRAREYERIEFLPSCEAPTDVFNLWTGYAVEPRRGGWPRLGRHIHEVLSCSDPEHTLYILRWTAWMFQNPGQPAEVALVFRGGRGTGKSTFGRLLCALLGQHGLQVSSSNHLAGRFNSHLRDCVLLFADEAVNPGDRDAESRLKSLITEPTLAIEGKGKDLVQQPNHLHVVMASNDEWVVPAGVDERRFAVFTVSEHCRQNRYWFETLHAELVRRESAAFMDAMLRMPLRDWHPRLGVPQNAALAEQKARSLPLIERRFLDCLISGELPEDATHLLDGGRMLLVVDRFCQWLETKQRSEVLFRKVQLLLGGRLGFKKDRISIEGARVRGWVVPPLHEARRLWDEATDVSPGWNDTFDWNSSDPQSSASENGQTPF